MDTENGSFFIEAISDEVPDEVTQLLVVDSLEDLPEARDTLRSEPANTLDTTAEARSSEVIIASGQSSDPAQEHSAPPQATLTFVIGEHRFSDSCELGVLNEHPEALKTITSNQSLTTSAFLNPALQAVMAELQQLMMVQLAVRLTAISLRLVVEVLLTQHPLPQYEAPGKDEQQKLAETVRRELDQAVPYYEWQGSRNGHGRVQYLMALLEEAIRVLAVPKELLTEALTLDVPAAHASQRVVQSILDLGERPADVCGVWAAETLLSAWASGKACQPRRCLTPDSSKADDEGVEPAGSPDSESEDELPSPSTFVRRKLGLKASQNLSRAEVRAPKAADNDIIKPSSAGRAVLIQSAWLLSLIILCRSSDVHLRLRVR